MPPALPMPHDYSPFDPALAQNPRPAHLPPATDPTVSQQATDKLNRINQNLQHLTTAQLSGSAPPKIRDPLLFQISLPFRAKSATASVLPPSNIRDPPSGRGLPKFVTSSSKTRDL